MVFDQDLGAAAIPLCLRARNEGTINVLSIRSTNAGAGSRLRPKESSQQMAANATCRDRPTSAWPTPAR
jgi:hypothetical protein